MDSNHFNEPKKVGRKKKHLIGWEGTSESRLASCEFLWKATQFLVQDEVTLLKPVAAIHRPWLVQAHSCDALFVPHPSPLLTGLCVSAVQFYLQLQ